MAPEFIDVARPLTGAAAEAYIERTCFKTGPPELVGVELEWLLHDVRDATAPVPASRLDGVLSSSLARGALSTEPGGQLELSSRPRPGLSACLAEVTDDLSALRSAVYSRGVRLTGLGVDPYRPPRRIVATPRYTAMEGHFDRRGRAGRIMMCSTAAVQVCLDAGDETAGPAGYATRWRALHALGPVLVSAFANSPLRLGRPTGWRSTRQAVWSSLDPTRTQLPSDGDPRAAWASYALDAEVLAIRSANGDWSAPPGLTFRAWLDGSTPRAPTYDDLAYHLSTLFPPVRPQGHYELRMIDAQPGDGWAVVAAVVTALLDDPVALDQALAAAEPVRDRWFAAAQCGPADPALAAAAEACFAAVPPALDRLGAPADIRRAVTDFTERYVSRHRCPADDVLDAWTKGQPVIPTEEVPIDVDRAV